MNWATHKTTSQVSVDRRALFRAADLLQKAWLILGKALRTWEETEIVLKGFGEVDLKRFDSGKLQEEALGPFPGV